MATVNTVIRFVENVHKYGPMVRKKLADIYPVVQNELLPVVTAQSFRVFDTFRTALVIIIMILGLLTHVLYWSQSNRLPVATDLNTLTIAYLSR